MQNTRLSESLNGNKASAGEERFHARAGRSGVEHSVGYPQGLRKESAATARIGDDQVTGNTQCHPVGGQPSGGVCAGSISPGRGGQASLSFFGCPGIGRHAGTVAGLTSAPTPSPRLSTPERRALLEVVLASLARPKQPATRPERDGLFADAPQARPAMLAHASDMREAFPRFHDDEEEDRLHRLAGAGYVETMLACD